MARIDLELVLSGGEYSPSVGAEYEIGPGVVGKMRYPTIALQRAAQDAAEKDSQLAACKLVLDGLPDELDEESIGMMPAIVVADFFSFALRIGAELQKRYEGLGRLVPHSEREKSQAE